jgi:hypothetical protein
MAEKNTVGQNVLNNLRMYTNIPRKDIINIINDILENNTEIQLNIQNEIIYILKIVMEQNCLQFDQ